MTEELFNLIGVAYSQDADQPSREAATQNLVQIKNQIDSIPLFKELLYGCSKSGIHLIISFVYFRDIVDQRGCLMGIQQLLDLLNFLMQYIVESAEFLSLPENKEILKYASMAYASISRLLYEINPGNDEHISKLQDFLQEDSPYIIIALSIMSEITNKMKENVQHLDITENSQINSLFKSKVIPYLFQISIQFLTSDNVSILEYAVNLANSCLRFRESKLNEVANTISFSEMKPFFQTIDVISILFQLCENTSLSYLKDVIDTIVNFMSITGVWNSLDAKIEFYSFCGQRIDYLLNLKTLDNFSYAKLIAKLGTCLDYRFLDNPVSLPFFQNVEAFSSCIFNSGDENAVEYILDFWSYVSNWKPDNSKQNLPDEFLQLLFNVFSDYINSCINLITQKLPQWNEETHVSNSKCLQKLWKLTIWQPTIAMDMLTSLILQQNSFSIHFAFLVNVATARLMSTVQDGIVKGVNIEESSTNMNNAIIKFISETNKQVSVAIQQDPLTTVCVEESILNFIHFYQQKSISGNRYSSNSSPQESDMRKNMEKDVINELITRMMIDLEILANNKSQLIMNILIIIDQLVSKNDSANVLADTTIMQDLISRNLAISFDNIDPLDAKKPRAFLNTIYARLVRTSEQFIAFIKDFNVQFEQLHSVNYANEIAVVGLYYDLLGVIRGFTCTDFHLRVLNWFVNDHSVDTINIINANGSSIIAVKAVCRLWVSLFPTSLEKLGKTSGVGIQLFRLTIDIVRAVLDNTMDTVERNCMLIRVIKSCLCNESTNFGVMRYYNDPSVDQMVELSFQLDQMALDDDSYKKIYGDILKTFQVIFSIYYKEISGDSQKLEIMINFIYQCLQLREEKIWTLSWKCLKHILNLMIDIPDLISWELLQRHCLIVIDYSLKSNEKHVTNALKLLMYIAVGNQDLLLLIISSIADTFEDSFKPKVSETFEQLFAGLSAPITKQVRKDFVSRIYRFKNQMRKYPIIFENTFN